MNEGKEGPLGVAWDGAAPHLAARTIYELCNVFGTPTGRRVMAAEGEPLPATPNGWSWRPVTE